MDNRKNRVLIVAVSFLALSRASAAVPEGHGNVLEVLEDRYDRRATVVASQLPIEHWHQWLSEPTLADAILDRLVHRSYRLVLKGPSKRKEERSENP